MINKKDHWENVFTTKTEKEVSWYQETPKTSLDFISKLNISKNAKIIDIGGGDSYFINSLLELEYTNLTLLDISQKVIERTKKRLGNNAEMVSFVATDILDFIAFEKYDYWHDRASFHFLITKNQIDNYAKLAAQSISDDGNLVIGTFSENGPQKCSGLDITQYNQEKMQSVFDADFELIESFTENHQTPFGTIQNFIFCSFKKKKK